MGNTVTGTAQPLETVHGKAASQLDRIVELCFKWLPVLIIVGWPGTIGNKRSARMSMYLLEKVHSRTLIPSLHYDEAYTTQVAKLEQAPVAGLDAQAACVLLQDWLGKRG